MDEDLNGIMKSQKAYIRIYVNFKVQSFTKRNSSFACS